jgi:hypothetical protein
MTLPIVVKTVNIGALFMSQNSSTSARRHFIDDGIVKVEFVKSSENEVSHEIYENFLGKTE